MTVYSCCAINCENNKTSRPDLIFFHFPSHNSERAWEWVVNLGRVDLLSKDMNQLWKSYVVCAEHFERHYFTDEQKRKLVYNAVPTIFNHCSHDVDVPLILEALNRIQSDAAAVNGRDEQIRAPAQCTQQSVKDAKSLNSQCGTTKSYRCQMCNEIFLSAHQLFSHELKDHEYVGISQIDHTKKQQLSKHNQCEKLTSSENGVHETKLHDRTLWKETSNLKHLQNQEEIPQTEASVVTVTSQKQDESHKIHTSNVGGQSQPQDLDQQTEVCNMRRKLQKPDGKLQAESSDMRGRSQRQNGIQQTHTSSMSESLQMQGGKQQAHTCNVGGKSQIQDEKPQTEASDTTRYPKMHYRCKLCQEIFRSSDSVCQHQIKLHDCESEMDTQNMNTGWGRDTVQVCHSELEGSTHEIRKHNGGPSDQNTYLACKESFISGSQQFVCEVEDHNKDTEHLQQGGSHCEFIVTGEGEENVSEVMNVPEVTPLLSKGTHLPYKCHVCEESFGTKCDLFYHDLQVHIGITKPTTIKAWDTSFKGAQKSLEEKTTLKEGEIKRKAKNIPEEQQPVKVIITDKQNPDEQGKHKIGNPVAEQVALKKVCNTDAGNKPIQELIVKKQIIQGARQVIKVGSGKHQHIQRTIEAITGKYPWNKTLIERGRGDELDERGDQTQSETFVIVKDGSQNGDGTQKISGGYRIDVVTSYVLPKAQFKQFMNYDGADKD